MRGVRIILASCFAATVFAAPRPVDFNREVRPILSDKCFQCHGPDEAGRKANLRLDDRDSQAKVVKAGDPAGSKLFQRITHDKKALRMPPAYSGLALTEAEIQVVKQWIAEGAAWQSHWAYVPPRK